MAIEMGKDSGDTESSESAICTGTGGQPAEAVERKCGITLVPPSTDI